MNCEVVKRRLLAISKSNGLPAELRTHLAYCGSCRAWRRRLLQLEQHVSSLPVPRSRGKSRFLRDFLREPGQVRKVPDGIAAVNSEAAAPAPAGPPGRFRLVLSRTMQSRPMVGSLAGIAALLLIAFSAYELRTRTGEPQSSSSESISEPLLAELVERDVRLSSADTPAERVAILADIADVLARDLAPLAHADAHEDLSTLARLYVNVVRSGLLHQARALRETERLPVLGPIADRLKEVANTAERLAQQSPVEQVQPLLDIVAVARQGSSELRALWEEQS